MFVILSTEVSAMAVVAFFIDFLQYSYNNIIGVWSKKLELMNQVFELVFVRFSIIRGSNNTVGEQGYFIVVLK